MNNAQEWFRSSIALVAAGVVLTLAGHLFTQARDVNEANDKRSLFYLESCVKAYEEARALLEDGNNDRSTWVAAGRALAHAKALSQGVKQDAHCRVLELHRLKYRSFFYGRIADKTAAFLYGAKDASLSTDEAVAASSAPEKRGGRSIMSTANALAIPSIHAVWEAAKWPTPPSMTHSTARSQKKRKVA